MSEHLDTSLPSIRLIQSYIREKKALQFKLTDGSTITGQLIWQDVLFYCVVDNSQKQLLIARSSVAVIAP